MEEVVDQYTENGRVSGDAQDARDPTRGLGREQAFERSGKRVNDERRDDEVLFAEGRLVVLSAKQLCCAETGRGDSPHVCCSPWSARPKRLLQGSPSPVPLDG